MATSQLTEIAEPTGFESCTISMSHPAGENVYTLSMVNGQDISVALMRPDYFGERLFASIALKPGDPFFYFNSFIRIPVYSIQEYARHGKFVVIGCVVITNSQLSKQQIDAHFFRSTISNNNEVIEYWYPEFFADISMVAQSEELAWTR